MMSLFSKARTITLGNLHTLLDAALDLNSVGAVKQHVRDLEGAKAQIQGEAAKARGHVASAQGEVNAIELKIKTDEEHIDLILGDDDPTNDRVAEKLQVQVIGYQDELKDKLEQLAVAQKTAEALADATRKICAKHAEMVSTVRRLERMESTAKAKEDAAAALKQAGSAASAAGEVSVDNIQQRMHDRSAVADEQFKDAMGTVSDSAEETVAQIQAKQMIAARRAKLAAAKNGGPQAETGAHREG